MRLRCGRLKETGRRRPPSTAGSPKLLAPDIPHDTFSAPPQSKNTQNLPEIQPASAPRAAVATQPEIAEAASGAPLNPKLETAPSATPVTREKLPSEYTHEENIAYFHVLARREAERRAREAAALFNYDDEEDPGWDDDFGLVRRLLVLRPYRPPTQLRGAPAADARPPRVHLVPFFDILNHTLQGFVRRFITGRRRRALVGGLPGCLLILCGGSAPSRRLRCWWV